jgi:raffinose/stachyose/melibiose transport system substrate-binding protein
MKPTGKKRVIAFFTLVLALALFLQACSGSSGNGKPGGEDAGTATAGGNQKAVELTFATHWVGEDGKAGIVQKIVDDFNAKYGENARVVIDAIPDDDVYQDKMKTNLATGSLPDIFTFYYNPVESLRYYSSGKLLDLVPYMNEEWKRNTNPDTLAAGQYEGQTLAVPLDQMITPFFYNKELFEQAGISSFPETWDGMIEAAEALKSRGIHALAMGTGENAWSAMLLYSYIVSSIGGPDVMKKGLDDPAYAEAAQILKNLFNYAPNDAVGATYQQYASHFINERAAIIVNGPWMISEFPEELRGKIGVGTSPAAPGGKGKQGALISGIGWMMAAKKQDDPLRAEYSARFIEFFTHPDNAKQIFLESGEVFESTNYTVDESEVDPISREILGKLREAGQTYDYFEGMTSSAVKIEFPASLSALVLDQLTPEKFAENLRNANMQ